MPVRVTLLHNPEAGFEQYTPEELIKELKKKGYDVNYASIKEDDYEDYLHDPGDLLVVAGGDGTVQKIATLLTGRKVPIGLLPLGTANNIAATLGIKGEPAEIIASWNLNIKKPFDVGVLETSKGKKQFIEAVGLGIFPELIKKRENDEEEFNSREEELQDALEHQQEILKKATPFRATIQLDEQQLEGDYLLVEIMNIKYTGPNMDLAPKADPGDGWLDVVLVKEQERKKFSSYLKACLRGDKNLDQFEVYRAKQIEITSDCKRFHIDDDTQKNNKETKLKLGLVPQGLEFLLMQE
ncbi:diacylglycerol/lipid kinase family protein [Pontibacter beigongshangensis]|uniref:diacylglycerol/lipid kinase family protein n=1 Tax=Pontibacter beigongshangensis TaxID=2574733 RepID=UPI00165030C1|nr:diacylglycerol kinase family protein [Pontibacter beigongshangensis]